jgi:hypothetical protein
LPPYVIRQGDYLAALAHQLGFDADTVWNDPSNAQLKQLRSDPNILFPGDVLQIPNPTSQPPATNLTPGSTNNFVSSAPTVTITVKLVGADPTTYASRAYTIQELDSLTGLTTDGNGVVTFQAPVTLSTATIVFTDTGESRALSIGSLDPTDTLSGIFQRLQNLGYIDTTVIFDPKQLDVLRNGLIALKESQSGPPSSAPASAPPPSVPPSDPSPASTPGAAGPVSTAPASAPASAPPASTPPSSAPASTPPSSNASPDSAPPSSQSPDSNPPSGPDWGVWTTGTDPDSSPDVSAADDNGGLSDDGTLDPDVKQMLLTAHGS